MATTGIWNHAAASISLAKAHPMDSSTGTSGGTGSTTGGATIGANDFLTLLVTEMQNQDPTATTDPNEYINQLVNVNSLEQLIQINQTLSSATGTGSASGAAAPAAHAAAAGTGAAAAAADSPAGVTNGNLGVPGTNAAAQQVAQALGSRLGGH